MEQNGEQNWVKRAKQGEAGAVAELFRLYWRAARAAAKSGEAVELADFSLFNFLKNQGKQGVQFFLHTRFLAPITVCAAIKQAAHSTLLNLSNATLSGAKGLY